MKLACSPNGRQLFIAYFHSLRSRDQVTRSGFQTFCICFFVYVDSSSKVNKSVTDAMTILADGL